MKTINDIVRKVAAEMLNTSMQDITADRIHGWATRLGATCKNPLQVGNVTKMREALDKLLGVFNSGLVEYSDWCNNSDITQIQNVIDKAGEALSAPARNCDLYTTFEHAHEVWRKIDARKSGPFEKWLFAEAKGENK